MRINLIGEMAKRRITTNALAELLGCHRNSVHNKLYASSKRRNLGGDRTL